MMRYWPFRLWLDFLTRKNTADFKTFNAMLNAGGNYFPSFDGVTGLGSRKSAKEQIRLAHEYDAAQAARGDARRASLRLS